MGGNVGTVGTWERAGTIRKTLDSLRGLSIALLGHERFGQHARDLVLLAALAGGPLTSHKASDVCGLPRGTVARRLARLEGMGLVQRRAGGAYTLSREAMSRLGRAHGRRVERPSGRS